MRSTEDCRARVLELMRGHHNAPPPGDALWLLTPVLLLRVTAGGVPPEDKVESWRARWPQSSEEQREAHYRGLVVNLSRLLDQSVRSYARGREELDGVSGGDPLGSFYRAVTEFEICIGSLHRAILFARRIRSSGFNWNDTSVFRDGEPTLSGVRNAIEHLDGDLGAARLPEESPLFLDPGLNDLEIASREKNKPLEEHRVTYQKLLDWMTELHAFDQAVVGEFDPNRGIEMRRRREV